jgi:hypothetical protein
MRSVDEQAPAVLQACSKQRHVFVDTSSFCQCKRQVGMGVFAHRHVKWVTSFGSGAQVYAAVTRIKKRLIIR